MSANDVFSPIPAGPSYEDLLRTFPAEILLIVEDDDYQGSSRVLLADGDRRGFLIFGWGSCSGCDALEAATDDEDITELRDDLWRSVQWEDSSAAMLAYLSTKDWTLDWGRGEEFGTQAIAMLDGA